jgi:ABC-2 type transport system permease protein
MSWQDVLQRDLLSVYRARTGNAVTALVAVFTVGAVSLMALTYTHLALVAAGGTVVAAAAVVALVFLGDSRQLGGAVVVYACFALVLAFAFPRTDQWAEPPNQQAAVVVIGSALSFVVPLVAMLGTYAALVGERERGSVRFLYGLPNSRDDVYLGKYLARSAVVVVPLVGGLLVGAVVAAFTFEAGASLGLLGVMLLSVPYALLFVGAGISASGVADNDNQAVALVVGVFVLFRAVWPAVQWLSIQGLRDAYPRPVWYFWIGRLNPMNAYTKLTTLFVDRQANHPLLTTPNTYEGPTVASQSLATSHELAVVVLLFWTVVAPLAGLAYYRRRDLL